MLKSIRNVPWEYGEIVPDFQMGTTTCALFLSLRYHNLHPEYIHGRIRELGRNFRLRVLLVLTDVPDCQTQLMNLAKLCVNSNMCLMLAWSNDEAGRYLETYKSYENKSADALQERKVEDYLTQAANCLTTIKSVNRADAVTLLSTFSSLKGVVEASSDELRLCPGLGGSKVERLQAVFTEPFVNPSRARESRFK